jgi:hypothetical protein
VNLSEAVSPATRATLESSGAWARMSVRRGALMRPLMLICETINVCNSQCVFCAYTIQTRPRGLMSLALFRRVVEEYRSFGGGCLSLTPMVGDVLLDRLLPERLEVVAQNRDALRLSMTTNLYALDRWSDAQVRRWLETADLIHVSCYGIDRDETLQITQKDLYARFVAQMRRLLDLRDGMRDAATLRIGFRLLEERAPEVLVRFQREAFGRELPVSSVSATYNNWGGAMRGELPGQARYAALRENGTACVQLAVALMVFWDGRLSACSCCDYDASPDLVIGDLAHQGLLEAFNGAANQALWRRHEEGDLPEVCRRCTFHLPLGDLVPGHLVLSDVQSFIGG